MAITAALLTAAGSATDAASYTTASITPTASRLVLAAVVNEGAGPEETPTLSGNGLTWVEVLSVVDGGNTSRLTVFRALGASPSAGAVTIDFGGSTQQRCDWSIVEFSDVDTSGTNGSGAVVQFKTATGTGNAGTADFDNAFGDAVNNATYSANYHRSAQATAVEGSFAELSDILGEGGYLQVMWLLGEDQTPAPTWGGAGVLFVQAVVEIKAASGAATHEGTGSSSIVVTTTATGEPTHKATGSSSVVVTTTATGKATHFATGSTSVVVTTSATGEATHFGTGSSSVVVTTTASGLHTGVRSGSSNVVVTTTGAGNVQGVNQGAGSSSIVVSTTATGKPTHKATGACSVVVSTTATGKRRAHRTGSSSIVVTCTATGVRGAAQGQGSVLIVVSASGEGESDATTIPTWPVSTIAEGWPVSTNPEWEVVP